MNSQPELDLIPSGARSPEREASDELSPASPESRRGFTMIEVLVAITILSLATTIIWMTFSNVVFATGEVEEMLQDLHHGEYAMNNVVTALRSASFFTSRPEQYGFWLKNEDLSGHPADWISWVTSSAAFMPPDSPLINQMHRISLTIEEASDGEVGLAVSAYPHLLDPESEEFEKYEEADPWIVSKRIIGLECKVYNDTEKAWEEEWEQDHRLPNFVEITFYLKPDPEAENDDPKTLTQMIHIPLATYAKNHSRYSDRDAAATEGGQAVQPIGGTGAGSRGRGAAAPGNTGRATPGVPGGGSGARGGVGR